MKKFEKFSHYQFASACYISGIYKIVRYRGDDYAAYFMQDFARNWGDYVPGGIARTSQHGSAIGRTWMTLAAAKKSCIAHSRGYMPALKTLKRAAEIQNSMREQQ